MRLLLAVSLLCGCIRPIKSASPSGSPTPPVVREFERWSGIKLEQTVTVTVVDPREIPRNRQIPCSSAELVWRAFDLLPGDVAWNKAGLANLLSPIDSGFSTVSNDRIDIRIGKGVDAELATLE